VTITRRFRPFQAPAGAKTLLYQPGAEHCVAFRDRRAAEGRSLPGYVEVEFVRYLQCGRLKAGFLRFQCESCQAEKYVALSCKGRAFCSS